MSLSPLRLLLALGSLLTGCALFAFADGDEHQTLFQIGALVLLVLAGWALLKKQTSRPASTVPLTPSPTPNAVPAPAALPVRPLAPVPPISPGISGDQELDDTFDDEDEERPVAAAYEHFLSFAHQVYRVGNYAQAAHFLRQGLPGLEQALGPDHPRTIKCLQMLAACYEQEQDYSNAEALYRRLVASRERISGPEAQDTLESKGDLGTMLWKSGQLAAAEQVLRETLAGEERTLPAGHKNPRYTLGNLAQVLAEQHRDDEAEACFRRLITLASTHLPAADLSTARAQCDFAVFLRSRGRTAESVSLARAAHAALAAQLGADHPGTIKAAQLLS